MKLITGLGNPGLKYKKTRHNVGFIIIDDLKKILKDKSEIILLKPQTFMNNSGKDVQKYLKYHNLKPSPKNLIVIHDDIDLDLGTIRVSTDSSSAGHNGVQSVINEVKSQNFTRIRIGIKPDHTISDTKKFVLQKFNRKEKGILKKIIKKTADIIQADLEKEFENATYKV